MHRVPVFKTVLGAYAFVWQARKDFVSLAIPLVVAVAIVSVLYGWLWPPVFPFTLEEFEAAMANRRGGSTPAMIVLAVFNWAVYVVFAIAWHRRYLVPAEATTVGAALRWRRRQTRFVLLLILVFLIVGLVYVVGVLVYMVGVIVIAAIGVFPIGDESQSRMWALLLGGGSVVVVFLAMPIYGRLTMWFPSTAVDHRMSLRQCWAFSRGNGWRLGVIIFLAALPAIIPVYLIYSVSLGIVFGTGLTGSLTAQFIFALVQNGISFIGTAAGVSALSITYRELMTAGAGAASPPAAGA